MQRRKSQMARFRNRECSFDRLEIPHLADKDDIGVLPEHISQCSFKGNCIGIYFTLVDKTLLVSMEVFNRVFYRYNVLVSFRIDSVYHHGKGGGFAASCSAGNK